MITLGPIPSRIAAAATVVPPAIFWGVFGLMFLGNIEPPTGFPWLPPKLVGFLIVVLPVLGLMLAWFSRTGTVDLPVGIAAGTALFAAAFLALAIAVMVMGF